MLSIVWSLLPENDEDLPWGNAPRKAIKACPGKGQDALSLREWPCHPFFSIGLLKSVWVCLSQPQHTGPKGRGLHHNFLIFWIDGTVLTNLVMVLRFYENKMTQLYLSMCFYSDKMLRKSRVLVFGNEESHFSPCLLKSVFIDYLLNFSLKVIWTSSGHAINKTSQDQKLVFGNKKRPS